MHVTETKREECFDLIQTHFGAGAAERVALPKTALVRIDKREGLSFAGILQSVIAAKPTPLVD